MGIMSKGSGRVSGRPLHPSAAERDEDIQSMDDTDVIFSLGQKCLADYYAGSPSTPTSDSVTGTPGLNTSSASSTSADVTQEMLHDSYADVTRLLFLYSSLKDVPSELEVKYSNLKDTSDAVTESISQIRSLSLNVVAEEASSTGKSGKGKDIASGSSANKISSKSKSSRKKN